ncbi:hypothetical protein AB0C65_35695 [Nocardia sp. NPDC048505]|uniref:hypothetical protein n=1 Tax=Nocardia sp. NPDC048505 TaxID=3155756 RepID=UPI0033E5D149
MQLGMEGSATVAKLGRPENDYTTERVVFRLHENVEALVDDLRGCTCSDRTKRCKCGAEDRSAFLTKLLAKAAKKKLDELLVPNRPEFKNQMKIQEELRRSA